MSVNNLTTATILATLAEYRLAVHPHAHPQKVVELGKILIERRFLINNSHEDAWTLLEQVAMAAIECGKLDLANVCVTRLATRFPDSPRVAILQGSLLEGRGLVEEARDFYERVLEEDETDMNIRKRLISLHLHSIPSTSNSYKGKSTSAVSTASATTASSLKEISQARGIELYAQSLSALSHLLVLAPENPYHLLHHAETAYTLGEYELAYGEMLRVVEMCEGVHGQGGAGRRAAMGLKMCIARFSSRGDSKSKSIPTKQPRQIPAIDLLMTRLILETYSSTGGAVGRRTILDWIGGGE